MTVLAGFAAITLSASPSTADKVMDPSNASVSGELDETVVTEADGTVGGVTYDVDLRLPELAALPLPYDTRFTAWVTFDGGDLDLPDATMRMVVRHRKPGSATTLLSTQKDELRSGRSTTAFASLDAPSDLEHGDVLRYQVRFNGDAPLPAGTTLRFSTGWRMQTDPAPALRDRGAKTARRDAVTASVEGAATSVDLAIKRRGPFDGYEWSMSLPAPDLTDSPAGDPTLSASAFNGNRDSLLKVRFTIRLRRADGSSERLLHEVATAGSFLVAAVEAEVPRPTDLAAGDSFEVRYKFIKGERTSVFSGRLFLTMGWTLGEES